MAGEANQIDLSTLKLHNMPAEPAKQTFTDMSKINNEEKAAQPVQPSVQLSSMNIPKEAAKPTQTIHFGEEAGAGMLVKKHYHVNYWRIFVLSFLTIVLSAFISVLLYIYGKYINLSTQAQINPTYYSYIQTYKNLLGFINNYVKINNYDSYTSLSLIGEHAEKNINTIINATDLNYIQKKDLLQAGVTTLSTNILTQHQQLDEIKKDITKYGFFPQDVSILLQDQEDITSIQRSLLSLETIKFHSAVQVFALLDTFLEGLAQAVQLPKETVKIKMQDVIAKGEKDINLYINTCYLNPFEINYDCNTIDDFDGYYALAADTGTDLGFFKKLMYYIDIKLEQTQLPSFTILFNNFDKNSDQITFTIDINTFKQDEIELAKQGVLNPHVFILTNLINLLKQSKYIVGKSINIQNLDITPKTLSLGSSDFVVHNSNKTFTLPIQKSSEREIFDFVDSITPF